MTLPVILSREEGEESRAAHLENLRVAQDDGGEIRGC